MPRPKGSKNKNSGRRFKSYEGRFPDDKHLRLTKNMLDDPAYKNLSSSAKVLYQYMKLWACGRDSIDFSISLANDLMDKKTFLRARDELVKKGFIDYINRHRAQDMRETAEYEFSNRWSIQPFDVKFNQNG